MKKHRRISPLVHSLPPRDYVTVKERMRINEANMNPLDCFFIGAGVGVIGAFVVTGFIYIFN